MIKYNYCLVIDIKIYVYVLSQDLYQVVRAFDVFEESHGGRLTWTSFLTKSQKYLVCSRYHLSSLKITALLLLSTDSGSLYCNEENAMNMSEGVSQKSAFILNGQWCRLNTYCFFILCYIWFRSSRNHFLAKNKFQYRFRKLTSSCDLIV